MSAAHDDATVTTTPRQQAASRARTGANWFYWIAGLTLLNSFISAFGGEWNLIFGLGIGQVFMAIGRGLAQNGGGSAFIVGGLLMSLGCVAIYVLWGWLAGRGRTVGFLVGMIFYGLDAGIFVVAGDWLGAGFHFFALFVIGRGFTAHRELQGMTEEEPVPAQDPQRDAAQMIVEAVEGEKFETVR